MRYSTKALIAAAFDASLCASVSGIDAISSEADRFLATASLQISATPTYLADVTGLEQASAILATASAVSNLGNPASGTAPGVSPPCAVCSSDLYGVSSQQPHPCR